MSKKIALIALIASLCLAPHVQAQADPQNIQIPAGDLMDALATLARQSSVEIVYLDRDVKGVHTKGVSGKLSVEEAITRLLEGTPLILRTDSSGALLVGPPSPKPAAPGSYTPSRSEEPDGPVAADARKAIPEILVEGSRVFNTDIQRTRDDTQPYVVFDRTQIERSQASNLEDFLARRLPMNTVQFKNAQDAASIMGGQSSVNLRGLGTNQTLILVDGRRLPSTLTFDTFAQPDINGIPLAAIERIEVLPSTASGIYGGGATGGVINIILKRNYSGSDVAASYGDTFDSAAASRRFDLNGGFNLERTGTHVTFNATHATSNPFLIRDRDFVERGRALQFANNPASFLGTATPPIGRTTNIRSSNGSNLVLKPGYGSTPLNSPITYVPEGYAGVTSDNAAGLVANAGRYNLGLPDDLNGARRTILSAPTINSASLGVRQDIGASLEGFLDVMWAEDRTGSRWASLTSNRTLAANAPNNPFTTAVIVRFPTPTLDFTQDSETESLRVAGGLILRLPHDWSTEADYVWSRARFSLASWAPALGDPDGIGPGQSFNNAVSNGTLDVLRDINALPLDYSSYLMPAPSQWIFADTILKDVTLRASGPLFDLPAGPVTLSALAEHQEQEADDSFNDALDSFANFSTLLLPQRGQKINSLYVETRIPLFSAQNARPGLQSLELDASVRRDEYQTRSPDPSFGFAESRAGPFPPFTYSRNEVQATRYTLGLLYTPFEDLKLRTSLGTGFLPPAINQIAREIPQPTAASLIDPKRGGVADTVAFDASYGGSPSLVAEDSRSWSAGFVFTPRAVRGLRWSVDYTRIEKDNEIANLETQQLLSLEDLLPGRVVRDALTPADAALGYTGGVITAIDQSALNISSTRLEAWDTQLDYELKTARFGEFHFYTVATWMPTFERNVAPTLGAVDFIGYNLGQLEWRGNVGVNWERGPLALEWNTQYYDSYHVYTATDLPETRATLALNQGSSRIPHQVYHDISARYRFGDVSALHGLADNTEIAVGVQNVFNEIPPILATVGGSGGYSQYGDPRLRRFTVSVRKSF